METFNRFTSEEKEYLKRFLPNGDDQENDETLEKLFSGKSFFFKNPLNLFHENLKSLAYTEYFNAEARISRQISNLTPKVCKTGKFKPRPITYRKFSSITSEQESESEINLSQSIESERKFSNFETGYTTDEAIDLPPKSRAEDSFDGQYNKSAFILPAGKSWRENYHRQEFERYMNPIKAWTYILPDGSNAVVAPATKKILSSIVKLFLIQAREHVLLKSDRPPSVTILSLVRDAAAKLHKGVGTRGEICDLLKESQFINDDVSEETV